MARHALMTQVFALPVRIGDRARGTDNEAPIFDRRGEIVAEFVDDDCWERAAQAARAINAHDDLLAALKRGLGCVESSAVRMAGSPSRGNRKGAQVYADVAKIMRAAIAKAEG